MIQSNFAIYARVLFSQNFANATYSQSFMKIKPSQKFLKSKTSPPVNHTNHYNSKLYLWIIYNHLK